MAAALAKQGRAMPSACLRCREASFTCASSGRWGSRAVFLLLSSQSARACPAPRGWQGTHSSAEMIIGIISRCYIRLKTFKVFIIRLFRDSHPTE